MVIPGSILKPKMMEKRVSLPAPMMMITTIGAIATIGLAGIILGPLFATLLVSKYRPLISQMKVMKGDMVPIQTGNS
ncbi:MAG: AI-2E family transporter [Methanospirillaceae archaeon]|nr:AI-2E family transporter [Methanospirillaceae archaeon]